MDQVRYELVVLKYASKLATELCSRAKRLEVHSIDLLPEPDMIKKKTHVDKKTFTYLHGPRNLLPAICRTSLVTDPNPNLIEAVDDFYSRASLLANYIIPLDKDDDDEEDSSADEQDDQDDGGDDDNDLLKKALTHDDFVEVYLVKEAIIVKMEKMNKTTLFIVQENSKYEELMKYVIQMVDIYENMDIILTEKERLVEVERINNEQQGQSANTSMEAEDKEANAKEEYPELGGEDLMLDSLNIFS